MAGKVRPLSNGNKTGTGTLVLASGYDFGGVDLNCDGTNEGTVQVRDDDENGTVLIDTASVTGKTIIAPFHAKSGQIYYSVSGTGADCMFYEWVE